MNIDNTRRAFLFGAGAVLIAAPAIVRAASLMPIRAIQPPIGSLALSFAETNAIFAAKVFHSFVIHGSDAWGEPMTEVVVADGRLQTSKIKFNYLSSKEPRISALAVADIS